MLARQPLPPSVVIALIRPLLPLFTRLASTALLAQAPHRLARRLAWAR
jgi:hypothetical protein